MATFGYTSIGASEMGTGANAKVATRFQAPESGTITSLTSYNKNVNNTNPVNLFVYSDNNGAPGALLGWGATPNFAAVQTYEWISVSGLNIAIVAGNYYWLGVQSRGSEQIGVMYDSGSTNQMAARSDSTPPDDPFGTPTYYARKQSIYATYTPSAVLKAVTDSLSLSDAVLRDKTLLPIADAVGVADFVLGDKTLLIADSVTLAELILRNKTLLIADSVGAVDSVLGNKNPLIISDAVSLADLIDVITGAIIKTVLDSVNLADVAKVLKTLNVSDALSLVDVAYTPSRVLQALDSVGLADNITVNKVLQITETVSLVEIVEVGVGGVKKTRLFLILGDLAVQLTGD